MARDAITEQAKIQIARASIEIEAQIASKQGARPVLFLIREAQDDCAEALTAIYTQALTESNPATEDERRKLWLRVAVYDEIIRLVRKVVDDGYRYERELSEAERDELADMISPVPEGQDPATVEEAYRAIDQE